MLKKLFPPKAHVYISLQKMWENILARFRCKINKFSSLDLPSPPLPPKYPMVAPQKPMLLWNCCNFSRIFRFVNDDEYSDEEVFYFRCHTPVTLIVRHRWTGCRKLILVKCISTVTKRFAPAGWSYRGKKVSILLLPSKKLLNLQNSQEIVLLSAKCKKLSHWMLDARNCPFV